MGVHYEFENCVDREVVQRDTAIRQVYALIEEEDIGERAPAIVDVCRHLVAAESDANVWAADGSSQEPKRKRRVEKVWVIERSYGGKSYWHPIDEAVYPSRVATRVVVEPR